MKEVQLNPSRHQLVPLPMTHGRARPTNLIKEGLAKNKHTKVYRYGIMASPKTLEIEKGEGSYPPSGFLTFPTQGYDYLSIGGHTVQNWAQYGQVHSLSIVKYYRK